MPITPPTDVPPWRDWLAANFPHVCTSPFAPRHENLWKWFENLVPGVRPQARVEAWPRGGAKSSTGELATAWTGERLTRRFVLYVCETQEQADFHVQSIASLFETVGEERSLNKYGKPEGWRREQLRTARGFNVAGIGLDKATRGIKINQYRPDLIIFDDIDNAADTPLAVQKKIRAIKKNILPAGSTDVATLFLQNLIHENSIVSMMVDGRADFLLNREKPVVEPAVYGLETERYQNEAGASLYRITAGTASWEGQNLAVCAEQLNDLGLQGFLEECQHQVSGVGGYVFDTAQLRSISPQDVPPLVGFCLAGDLAATENGGDYTVYFLLGKAKNNTYYVLAVIRGQWSPDRVQGCLTVCISHYKPIYPTLRLRLPQDPGQAGKAQRFQMQETHRAATPQILPVTGSKAIRASGLAKEINRGNVYLVEQDLPEVFTNYIGVDGRRKPLITDLSFQSWHTALKYEFKQFREEELHQVDDQVDAGADAFNVLVKMGQPQTFQEGMVT